MLHEKLSGRRLALKFDVLEWFGIIAPLSRQEGHLVDAGYSDRSLSIVLLAVVPRVCVGALASGT